MVEVRRMDDQRFQQEIVVARLLAREEGVTIGQLMETLKVSQRTVYRIIEHLGQLGGVYISCTDKRDGEGIYHLKLDDYPLEPLLSSHFSEDDLLFLLVIKELMQMDVMKSWFSRTINRVSLLRLSSDVGVPIIGNAFLNAPVMIGVEDVPQLVPEGRVRQLMMKLLGAIKERVVLSITSVAPDQTSSTKDILPLCCFSYYGTVYLNGEQYNEERNVILFPVLCITAMSKTFKSGVMPVHRPFELLEDPFGIILEKTETVAVVKVTSTAAWYVKGKSWPRNILAKEQPDGSLVLRIRTRCLLGLKSWILSCGSAAQVISPESLRIIIQREHAASIK